MQVAQAKSVCCVRDDHGLFSSLLPSRVQEEVWGGAWFMPGRDRRVLHRGELGPMHGKVGAGKWLYCCMPQEEIPKHGLDRGLSTQNGPFLPANTLLPCLASQVSVSCTVTAQWFIHMCMCLSRSVDKYE